MSAPTWWIEAATQTIYGIRKQAGGPVWEQPGIRAQLLKLISERTVSAGDAIAGLALGAQNPKLRTPAAASAPGPQWADTQRTTPVTSMCPDHDGVRLIGGSCPECTKTMRFVGKPASFRDTYQAALEQARADNEWVPS